MSYRGGVIQIGFGKIGILDNKYERATLQICGTIYVEGRAIIGQGSRIHVGKSGKLYLGDNFAINGAVTISCSQKIIFGRNVLLGWNTMILDSDFHEIINKKTNEVLPMTGEINIGDNVWAATKCIILKNSSIPNGCIVGAGSVVSKKYDEENCLIAGNPAKVIKNDITRKI